MNNAAEKLDNEVVIDQASYETATRAIRAEAKRLLESGDVTAVIGWKAGRRNTTSPVVVRNAADADILVFSPSCVNNLSLYLTKAKKDVATEGKVAIVVKGCDLKALAGLMGESQVKRDALFLIGVACAGVYGGNADRSQPFSGEGIAAKCPECDCRIPLSVDCVAGKLEESPQLSPLESAELARLEALSPSERWAFWKEHFSRCVRCMACRQICPFCYCEQCLCDRNRPQAVENSIRPSSNMAWHIVRAMHLAGRCAGCAECERVCPMDIPLNLLNRKMARELKEMYGDEAGMEPREKRALTTYREDDDQSFIK